MTRFLQVALEKENKKGEERIQHREVSLHFSTGEQHIQSLRNKALKTHSLKQRSSLATSQGRTQVGKEMNIHMFVQLRTCSAPRPGETKLN